MQHVSGQVSQVYHMLIVNESPQRRQAWATSEGAHLVLVYLYGPFFVAATHALCCAMSSAADRLLNDCVVSRPRPWLATSTCAVARPGISRPDVRLQG